MGSANDPIPHSNIDLIEEPMGVNLSMKLQLMKVITLQMEGGSQFKFPLQVQRLLSLWP